MFKKVQIELRGAHAAVALRSVPAEPMPGPGQVLLEMRATSLNYRDLLTLDTLGAAGVPDGSSVTALSDGVGIILAVGAGVSGWTVGERVSPNFFPHWTDGAFQPSQLGQALGGATTDGVLAQRVLVPASSLVRPAAHLSDAEAACLPCAGLTAWHALFERGGLRAGQTVLVQGTGGVALLGMQLAQAAGARVIVTSSSDAKLARAQALGAWQTINYHRTPDWDVEALRLTEGVGVDHILELGGPDTYDRSIRAVAPGGSIAQIGVLSGFNARPDIQSLQFKNASIHGICVGSVAQFQRLQAFVAEHGLRPIIDRRFALAEAAAAYAYFRGQAHFGKVVILC